MMNNFGIFQTFSHSTTLTSVSNDPFTCWVTYKLKKSQKWWYMFTTAIKKIHSIIINIKFMLITEVIHERHNDKEKTGLFIISWCFYHSAMVTLCPKYKPGFTGVKWKINKPASNFMKKVGFSTRISQCSSWFGLKDKEEKSSTSFNLEKVVTQGIRER